MNVSLASVVVVVVVVAVAVGWPIGWSIESSCKCERFREIGEESEDVSMSLSKFFAEDEETDIRLDASSLFDCSNSMFEDSFD